MLEPKKEQYDWIEPPIKPQRTNEHPRIFCPIRGNDVDAN